MKKNFLTKAILLFCFAICLSLFAFAGDPGGGGLSDPDTTAAPIDGGVSLLIAAGVGYGVKKYRDSRKKQKEQENNSSL